MAMQVQESFVPKPMTASGALLGSRGGAIAGFICTVAGNIRLTYGTDGTGAVILDTCPVTAGQFLPIPLAFGDGTPVYAALTGGAQGTFCIL
jgi:hypothetical protein